MNAENPRETLTSQAAIKLDTKVNMFQSLQGSGGLSFLAGVQSLAALPGLGPTPILRDDFAPMVSNTGASNLKSAAQPRDAGGV
jgi:hypothetical protein